MAWLAGLEPSVVVTVVFVIVFVVVVVVVVVDIGDELDNPELSLPVAERIAVDRASDNDDNCPPPDDSACGDKVLALDCPCDGGFTVDLTSSTCCPCAA